MKIRIKRIRIVSRQELDKDSKQVARAFDEGRIYKSKYNGLVVESLDLLHSILTERRLALWRAIRDHKPESISDAAKLVGRSFRAVHRDIQYLEAYGLISVKKSKGERGDCQIPTSLADQLHVAVA